MSRTSKCRRVSRTASWRRDHRLRDYSNRERVEKKATAFKGTACKRGKCTSFDAGTRETPSSGGVNVTVDGEEEGLDGSLVKSFRDDLTQTDSKDGIGKDLFPLSSEQQKDMMFELTGEKEVAGRTAYFIRFGPKDRNDYTWAGEALIDKEEFQPVSVYTRLSRRLPPGVRVLLGTDVPGLGFNVRYARVDKNVSVSGQLRDRVPHPRGLLHQPHAHGVNGEQELQALLRRQHHQVWR